jgi:hypothetical protein
MMRRPGAVLVAMVAALLVSACGRQPQKTPPEVARAYSALLAGLDATTPGASVARLKDFARRNASYPIAQTVEMDMAPWRRQLEPAYLRARDLVRDGRFDQAQAVLADLAQLDDEPAGRMARDFLSFEFHRLKASQLLLKGDTAGAAVAARELRSLPLAEGQRSEAERLLDSVGLVDSAAKMSRVTALQSAARVIQVALVSSFMDEGRYPETLSLESPVLASLRNPTVLGPVASLDDYTVTGDAFSLIVRAKDGQRFRVTPERIEPIP